MLRQVHQIILYVASGTPSLVSLSQEISGWVDALDGKYGERVIWLGPPYHLEAVDAGNLARDSERWIVAIISAYSESGTITITEEAITKLFTPKFLETLDPLTRDDLVDGASCILHLLPTPAAMILLRVAENMARKYSDQILGKAAKRRSWGRILEELEKRESVKKSTLGYLHYLKDKRNEAEHPDKRFSQEEAERIFIQVKALLDELLDQDHR